MVVDAAFEIAREAGAEAINAREVAKRLRCSTQPVMYHFATIEALKRAAYDRAGHYHTEYLLRGRAPREGVMLGIGLNYIRFAREEGPLFRFLFQSGFVSEKSLPEMVDARELTPILAAMQDAMGMSLQQTKEIFVTLALFVHGYASILANNSLEYDEERVKTQLERVYTGAVFAARQEVAE